VGDRLATRPQLIERTRESNPGPNLDLRLRPSMSLARPWRLMGHSRGRVALPLTALTNLLLTACTMKCRRARPPSSTEPALS
jgi:hypothetical protein